MGTCRRTWRSSPRPDWSSLKSALSGRSQIPRSFFLPGAGARSTNTGGGWSSSGPAPASSDRGRVSQQHADTPLLQGGMTPVRTEQYPSSASRGLSATWSAVWVTVTVQSAQDVGRSGHYGAHLRTVDARRVAEGPPLN